ncbi:MAG: sigma-70 family RNA polymerase sigma factor [Acidobacteriota bacterium]
MPFHEDAIGTDVEAVKLLALDQALDRLGERDQRMAKIVECRYFGGMPHIEIAEAIGVSVRTVERDWSRARTYLYKMLSPGPPTEEATS